jgi:hypothetical protein
LVLVGTEVAVAVGVLVAGTVVLVGVFVGVLVAGTVVAVGVGVSVGTGVFVGGTVVLVGVLVLVGVSVAAAAPIVTVAPKQFASNVIVGLQLPSSENVSSYASVFVSEKLPVPFVVVKLTSNSLSVAPSAMNGNAALPVAQLMNDVVRFGSASESGFGTGLPQFHPVP